MADACLMDDSRNVDCDDNEVTVVCLRGELKILEREIREAYKSRDDNTHKTLKRKRVALKDQLTDLERRLAVVNLGPQPTVAGFYVRNDRGGGDLDVVPVY